MPVTVSALRACGSREVALRTSGGSFAGRILQDRLGDDAVMLLLASDGDAGEPLVVPVDSIEAIVER